MKVLLVIGLITLPLWWILFPWIWFLDLIWQYKTGTDGWTFDLGPSFWTWVFAPLITAEIMLEDMREDMRDEGGK